MSTSRRTDQLRASILAIYEQLAALPSLEPDAYVTDLFTRLVTLTINERNATGAEIMRDPAIQAIQPHLHQLCAIGEYCLERSWSARIAHSASPEHELTRFPYYRNYQQLTLLERHAGAALSACAFKRTLFVGAGPLPLTPLLLAQHCEVQIDTIDVSDEASLLGQHLIERLGMTDRVRWYHTDILDFTRLEPYDTVVLAALVGVDAQRKARVIRHLAQHMRPGAFLVVRTADHLRALLYPPVTIDDIADFRPEIIVHPLFAGVTAPMMANLLRQHGFDDIARREDQFPDNPYTAAAHTGFF
jgi:nicotianamine synthase